MSPTHTLQLATCLHLSPLTPLRWDCGSGAGSVRSPEAVNLGEWNRLTVYRHRWDVWLQLNDGHHVQGRSEVR